MDQHDTNDERPWLQWDQGHPYSKRYGDRYFDRDGLAESDYVFLRHNDLPARWANRRAFTIGELGFGTGLNACLTLERWRQTAHPDACLDYISVESHPLGADDMRRALAQWPQLGFLSLQSPHPRAAVGSSSSSNPCVGAVIVRTLILSR